MKPITIIIVNKVIFLNKIMTKKQLNDKVHDNN